MHRFMLPEIAPVLSPHLYLVDSEQMLEGAFAIRRAVFIEEQAVSEAEEMDGLDALCSHLVYRPLTAPAEDVGTARLRVVTDAQGIRWGKLERIAVLHPWRAGHWRQPGAGTSDTGYASVSAFPLQVGCPV